MTDIVFGVMAGVVWIVLAVLPLMVLFLLFRAWQRLAQHMDRVERELVMINRQILELKETAAVDPPDQP